VVVRRQAGPGICVRQAMERGEDRYLVFTLFFAGAARRVMAD
jgi:hypothetical protein